MRKKQPIDLSRRQVLRGAAGVTLALPFLPSLAETSAYGGDPPIIPAPRLIWLPMHQGAARHTNMFPDPSLLQKTVNLFPDHAIKSGPLVPVINGNQAVLSPILSADASALTRRLASKMNVLLGLDVPFKLDHNGCYHLGNYANAVGGTEMKALLANYPRPTIDQICAYSASFYRDLGNVPVRTILTDSWGYNGDHSFNWTSPLAKTIETKGTVKPVGKFKDPVSLFDALFKPGTTDGNATPTRAPIVDHVLQSYKSLRDGNTRLSAGDRQRLNDHMDRLSELERVLTVPRVSCKGLTRPTDASVYKDGWQVGPALARFNLLGDIVAAAMQCGVSRIAVMPLDDYVANFVNQVVGNWHFGIVHGSDPTLVPGARDDLIKRAYQIAFEKVVLRLASALDVEEAYGNTYLDNSLLTWSQEFGQCTHTNVSMPVITFGSAAGKLKTGLFCDYRRETAEGSLYGFGLDGCKGGFNPTDPNAMYQGLLYTQWLGTVLRAMGIPQSEWLWDGDLGFTLRYRSRMWGAAPGGKSHYADNDRYFTMATEPLPFLGPG